MTSSDIWPDTLVNKIINKDIRKMSPNNIFSKEEIEKNVIDVAERNRFTLTEPIDFTHEDNGVDWRATTIERDYTFIFFALRENKSL